MSQIPPYPPYPHQPQTASSSTPIPLQPATATANGVPPLPPLPHGLIEYTESDDKVYKTRYFALKHLVQAVEDENNMLAYKLAQMTARCQRIEFDRVLALEQRKRNVNPSIPGSSSKPIAGSRSREKSHTSISALGGDAVGYEAEAGGNRRGSLTGIERIGVDEEMENGQTGCMKETKKTLKKSSGAPRKSRSKAQPVIAIEKPESTLETGHGAHSSAASPRAVHETAPSSPAVPHEVGEDEDELMDDY